MTWRLKKYCSFLSCCSANDSLRPLVNRVNRSLGVRRSPSTQKQGLVELLSSYQVTKNNPSASMKDWALTWARSGTLGHLVKIAFRLGARVNASSMDFVCLASALIVAHLSDKSHQLQDILEQILDCVTSDDRRSPFGVYRLLLVLLRIDHFKRKAMESSFMIRLHVHYQTLQHNKSIATHSSANENSSEDEESDDDDDEEEEESASLSRPTSDEEIVDDLLHDQSDEDKQYVRTIVPRLNFTWLKNVPSTASPSVPRPFEPSISIEQTSRTVEEHATTSNRSAPEFLKTCERVDEVDEASTPLDGRSMRKLKRFFRSRRSSEANDSIKGIADELNGLGISETITLLGNPNDTSFIQNYDLLSEPVQDWDLKTFLKEKETDARDREKLAILEVFLCIPPVLNLGLPAITLPKTLANDVLHSIQTGTIDANILHHSLAAYVEFTAPSVQSTKHRDSQLVKLSREGKKAPEGDILLEMLIREFQKTASVRRPGEGTFDKLNLLLSVTADYFRMSAEPMKIVNSLVFELEYVQKTFIKNAGHVAQWGQAHLRAFRSLLSFYESIFRKYKFLRDQIIFDELVAKTMEVEWILLMRELTEDLLCGKSFKCLPQNERYTLIVKTLAFFTSLLEHLPWLNIGKQTTQNRYLDDFDFLLAPRFGLVSVILESNDADVSIQEQALRLLRASCSLTRVSFLTDSISIESHLKVLVPQFLDLFHNTSIDNKQSVSTLILQLDVFTSMVACGDENVLTQILNSGLVELLINEVHEATLDISPSQRVHDNACYASSSHPPTTERSRQQPTARRTEPVEFFCDKDSSDSENEGDIMMPTFSMDLQFHDRREILEETRTVTPPPSSDRSFIIHPSNSSDDEVKENTELRLFCEQRTVDQLDNELFGQEIDEADVSTEETEQEEWPSDLSVHGDVDEDRRRWERYQVERDYEEGRISFETKQNRLATISASATTSEEEEAAAPSPPVVSFAVPLLNFERLRSLTSEATSAPASAQTHNPPLVDSPSLSNPPIRSSEREKQPLESAASPFDLSPVHRRHVSMLSSEFERETTGLVDQDDSLHLASVEFMIQLLLSLDGYDDQSSICVSDLITSMSSVLYHDLNGTHFTRLIPELLERIHNRGPAAFRMLRLLLQQLFEVDHYVMQERIYKGEVAHVKRCRLMKSGKGIPETCVVKVIDSPRDFLRADASILNVYSEVSLMERVVREPGFCQIYDYGIRSDSAYIVMQDCQCSLKDWIDKFPISSPWAIRLILNIFTSIAKSVHRLHQKIIVHFDLKCSNILLKGETDDKGFWFPETENPQFDVLLADFGVARCYEGQDFLGTVRNRGTEYSKAPEMLLITNMQKRDVRNYDRRRKKGVGSPSDVWALGCLLFELLTGQMLHFDRDWARFYTRVTQSMMPLFDDAKIKMLDVSYRSEILELLTFILVRDPQWRPSVAAIIDKVERLLQSDVLPKYTPPSDHACQYIPAKFTTVASTDDVSTQMVSPAKWAQNLLSGDTEFTLYLTRLRLSVVLLKGNLHTSQFQSFADQIRASEYMGVLFYEPTGRVTSTAFIEGFSSRMRRLCSHHQKESLFIPSAISKDTLTLSEVGEWIEDQCEGKSPESVLSIVTVHSCEMSFYEFLLDIIMSVERCPCLRAMSILKERVVRGWSISTHKAI